MKEEKQTSRFVFIKRERENENTTKIMPRGTSANGCKEIRNLFMRHRITV
jgi:hypothetical protein